MASASLCDDGCQTLSKKWLKVATPLLKKPLQDSQHMKNYFNFNFLLKLVERDVARQLKQITLWKASVSM